MHGTAQSVAPLIAVEAQEPIPAPSPLDLTRACSNQAPVPTARPRSDGEQAASFPAAIPHQLSIHGMLIHVLHVTCTRHTIEVVRSVVSAADQDDGD